METLKTFLKKKKVKISLLIVGILIFILGVAGFSYYSKDASIDRYIAARGKDGDVFENIKPYIVWADDNTIISMNDAKYTTFTKLENQEEKEALKKELQEADASANLYVKSVGSKFGIFPDYKIAVKPMSLTIKTNVNKMDILLNDKKVVQSNSDDYSVTLDKLPVADYKASISGFYKGKKVDISKSYDGVENTIDLSVRFKTFKVKSNITAGELYFSDRRIGSLKEGEFDVSEYPTSDSVDVYVKKQFPDGDLISNKVAMSDIADNAVVELNSDKALDVEKAGQVLVESFNKLLVYYSSGQDAADIATVFENGANNDYYKLLKDSIKAKTQTDPRRASSLSIPEIVINSVTQVGVDSYALNYSTTYDYYYDVSTDPQNGTTGHLYQSLTGEAIIKVTKDGMLFAKGGHIPLALVSENNQVKRPGVFPKQLIGTWQVKDKDYTATLTFAEDGTVSKKTVFNDKDKKDEVGTAKVEELIETGENTYRFKYASGTDVNTFTILPGLGGVNIVYDYGIIIKENEINLVIWSGSKDQAIDYSQGYISPKMSKIN
ncbi:zinc ribbon domain-containing protein [Streptococcus sp. CSL10205-OR2]|uniref:zinc ribbon domain-containing protein n=1 Tax=Streptococcus sp. CSL10205-OR2 TaxID=2980558 RepID=UPI0021D8E68E|nr:hypothetical protein [Streptococcus sp. CSL10205-OR2]MCU9533986.1 hypothetical protein [Streptococcus sp. CSL10205-OR2]